MLATLLQKARIGGRRRLAWVCVVMFVGLCLLWHIAALAALYLGAGRDFVVRLAPGSLCPPACQGPASASVGGLPRGEAALKSCAGRALCGEDDGKPSISPRIAVAKLYVGKDIEEVNKCICAAKPWKDSGSTWVFRPSGDYDFTEIEFITLLYLFGEKPEKLRPETVRHILDCMLIEDGAVPRPKVPRTFGLATETENHTLMTEATRYLKNQWRFEHGTPEELGNAAYDNARNGLGTWLLGYLRDIEEAGFYEFNSIPYQSFSVRALLNLDAFSNDPRITSTARHILDVMNWQYALGSLDLRRCVPFRRQAHRAGITDLQDDELTSFMLAWTSDGSDRNDVAPLREREEAIAALLPYRLPAAVRQWVIQKPQEYFVRVGHGPDASPELYSGGPNYLLSAGGVRRGISSMIAARPTSLLLRDGARDLRECFHLTGKGPWEKWNNTGVCKRFACTNGAVCVPSSRKAAATAGSWSVYSVEATPGLLVAVHNTPGVALLAVFPDEKGSPQELVESIARSNPDEAALERNFAWPAGGSVSYSLSAPRNRWVIFAVDGNAVDREYDRWPQLEGEGPKITFDR